MQLISAHFYCIATQVRIPKNPKYPSHFAHAYIEYVHVRTRTLRKTIRPFDDSGGRGGSCGSREPARTNKEVKDSLATTAAAAAKSKGREGGRDVAICNARVGRRCNLRCKSVCTFQLHHRNFPTDSVQKSHLHWLVIILA